MSSPLVSVLLPVYNGERYLQAAIQSILNQSFTDFELIVINDGSTDGTAKIVDSIQDKRVKVLHQANMGLPITLNRAIRLARGTYLARQDSDDLSLPTRLIKQVHFLEQHPQYGLLGTWADILLEDAPTNRALCHPTSNGQIQIQLLFSNCFVHSSVMMRKSILEVSGLYPEEPEKFPPEDYDLWLRIAKHASVANLGDALLLYREMPTSISRTKLAIMQKRAEGMSLDALQTLLPNETPTAPTERLIKAMTNSISPFSYSDYQFGLRLLQSIYHIKLQQFPDDNGDLGACVLSNQGRLKEAFLKAWVRRFAPFLPFDLVALLKRFR